MELGFFIVVPCAFFAAAVVLLRTNGEKQAADEWLKAPRVKMGLACVLLALMFSVVGTIAMREILKSVNPFLLGLAVVVILLFIMIIGIGYLNQLPEKWDKPWVVLACVFVPVILIFVIMIAMFSIV